MLIFFNVKPAVLTGDTATDAQLMDRGDIIDFIEDETRFTLSDTVLKHPDWRIIRVDLTRIEAEALAAEEFNPDNIKPFTYRRKFRLQTSFAGLPPKVKAFLTDNTRAVPIMDLGTRGREFIYAMLSMRV